MWGASARAHVHTSFARWCFLARSSIADQGVILVVKHERKAFWKVGILARYCYRVSIAYKLFNIYLMPLTKRTGRSFFRRPSYGNKVHPEFPERGRPGCNELDQIWPAGAILQPSHDYRSPPPPLIPPRESSIYMELGSDAWLCCHLSPVLTAPVGAVSAETERWRMRWGSGFSCTRSSRPHSWSAWETSQSVSTRRSIRIQVTWANETKFCNR